MPSRAVILAIVASVVLAGAIVTLAIAPDVIAPGEDAYDRTTVIVEDGGPSVDVQVADTPRMRYVGLSATEELPPGEGMLFVHTTEDTQTYVMRGMEFPIDIVFIGADGEVTTIHHAPADSDERYTGHAKYVLEVGLHETDRVGIEVGDRVRIEGY